jgi:hypothetical protein
MALHASTNGTKQGLMFLGGLRRSQPGKAFGDAQRIALRNGWRIRLGGEWSYWPLAVAFGGEMK